MDGSRNNVDVTSLEKWNPYRVTVEAWTKAGAGPACDPLETRTQEDVPDEPRRVRISPVTSSSLLVKWKAPKKPNGRIRGYQIHYQAITKQVAVINNNIDGNNKQTN